MVAGSPPHFSGEEQSLWPCSWCQPGSRRVHWDRDTSAPFPLQIAFLEFQMPIGIPSFIGAADPAGFSPGFPSFQQL